MDIVEWLSNENTKLIIMYGLVPGFIFYKILGMVYPIDSNKNSLIEIVISMAISFVIFENIILPISTKVKKIGFPFDNTVFNTVVYLLIIFAFPLILVILYIFAIKLTSRFRNVNPMISSAWDFYFIQKKIFIARITLKNGNQLIVDFDVNSHASWAKSEKDIYFEKVKYNGKDDGLNLITGGLYLKLSEIMYIEFFDYNDREKLN